MLLLGVWVKLIVTASCINFTNYNPLLEATKCYIKRLPNLCQKD